MILQVIPGTDNMIANYGVFGFMLVTMAYAVRFLYLRVSKRQDEAEVEVKEVRNDLKQYMDNDRVAMIKTLEACAEALNHNTDVMNDLKETIKNHPMPGNK
jgi:uncharacterized protein YbbC (DUF1343 family)